MNFVGGIARAGERAARLAHAVVPDPFVIAIGLSAAVMLAALVVSDRPAADLVSAFAFGFLEPGQIAFAFQMLLVLLTGSAIAKAPLVARAITRVAEWPRTSAQAAALVASVAMAASLLNWGIGVVLGALLVRVVGRSFSARALPLNYPAVGAAAYTGMAVWHGGLSGSAPLKVATAGPFGDAIPIADTVLSPMNLVTTTVVCVSFAALFFALGKSATQVPAVDPAPAPREEPAPATRAERLERSSVVLALMLVPLVAGLAVTLARKGVHAITLDFVILVFLALGLALHRSPRAYANAFADGIGEASGIALQFPLYFGIIAVARDGGLVTLVADAFSHLARLLPLSAPAGASLITYWSACVINVMVPSGGGQWAVQSPIILEMSRSLSLERAPLVMAFAYGDDTTNLLQPFWALPLLAISGLRARDIMGYTLVAMVLELLVVSVLLVAFA